MIINPHMNPSEIHSVNPNLVYVQVTEDDIYEGVACSSGSCPVALAIKRVTRYPYCYVGKEEVYMSHENRMEAKASLPQVARDLIKRFDQVGDKNVTPISFTLSITRLRP